MNLKDTASGSTIEITEGDYKDVLLYGFSGKIEMNRVRVTHRLHIEMLSGRVNIMHMKIPTNGNGNYNITLGSGNVFFSTTNNFLEVLHNEAEAGSCFQASRIVQLSNNETETTETAENNKTSFQISRLCSDESCSQNYAEQVILSVLRGAIFASLSNTSMEANTTAISSDKKYIPTLNTSWMSVDNRRSISQMKQYREEMPNTDIYVLVTLKESSLGSPPDFIFTNAPIYLQLAPWVLSSISFGIVTPTIFKISLQVVPKCGFNGGALHSVNDVGAQAVFQKSCSKTSLPMLLELN